MSTLLLSAGEGTAAADGEPPAVAGADGRADADGEACGCEPCGASRNTPSPASTTTTTAKSAFCWPAGRSIVPRYFLRRTGRSQKGIGLSGGDEPLSRPPRGAAGPDGPRSAARLPFAWPGAEVSRALLRVGARPPPDELPDGPPAGGSGERGRPAQPPDGSAGRIGQSLHWSRSGCWHRSRYWSRSRRKSRFRRWRRGPPPGGPRRWVRRAAAGRAQATEPGTDRTSSPRAGTAVRLRTGPRRTTTIQPNGTLWVRCPPGAGLPGTVPGWPRQPRRGAQWMPGGPWPGWGHGRRAPWSRAAAALPRFVRSRPPGRRRGPSRTMAGPPGLRFRRRGAAGAAVARPVGRRRRLASAGRAPPRWAALRPAR